MSVHFNFHSALKLSIEGLKIHHEYVEQNENEDVHNAYVVHNSFLFVCRPKSTLS